MNDELRAAPNQLFCFLFFSSLSNEKKEENKQELKGLAAKDSWRSWWWLIGWLAARLWAAPAALLRKEKQTSTTPPTIEIHECNE